MTIVDIVNPAWNIVNPIVITVTACRVTYYNSVYINTSEKTYLSCDCRAYIIRFSIVINLKIISVYYLRWIFKLYMSFKIIIKICRRNIFHPFVKLYIFCIGIYGIYLDITRYSFIFVVPPFKETCIFKCRYLEWLFIHTNLRICILNLILADHIRQ